MADAKWDRELAKIDKQLSSMSDEALLNATTEAKPKPLPGALPRSGAAATIPASTKASKSTAATSTFGVAARLALAASLGIAILFWPYASRCGLGLAAYLGGVGAVVLGGVWSAVWSWRHRAPRMHLLSLALATWGVLLASAEILPRTGYAVPTARHPAIWACE